MPSQAIKKPSPQRRVSHFKIGERLRKIAQGRRDAEKRLREVEDFH